MKKLSIFDILNSVSGNKIDLSNDALFESTYDSFMINRFIACDPSTVFYANWMNSNFHIPKKYQYLIYLLAIPQKKRFFKYEKEAKIEESVKIVKSYFGINNTKAMDIVSMLTDEQINEIKKKMNIGGKV